MTLRLPLVLLPLALAPLTSAQGPVTSPAGLTNVEGNSHSNLFGVYEGGRFMFCDGEHRGGAMTLKGASYRSSNYSYTATYGTGRSWTNVQLDVSECDFDTFSSTFSSNATTTPTTVFSAPVSWPTRVGKPGQLPGGWDYAFPFATNWVYSGTRDICLDYKFTGGTLANAQAWSSTSFRGYYLDGVQLPTSASVGSTPLGAFGNGYGCNDRGVTHLYGAKIATQCTVYNQQYSSRAYRDRLRLTQSGSHFAVSAPAITVLGFRSIPGGLEFPGVSCNKLYVETRLPTMMFSQITNTGGYLPTLTFGTGSTGAPFSPGFTGLELVTQSAWSDSRSRRLMLSSAATLQVPEMPPLLRRSVVYSWNSAATTGSGPTVDHRQSPVVRYER